MTVLRLRVIEPADRRSWQEPYIAIYCSTDTGAVIGTAIIEELEAYGDSRDPGAWSQVAVIHD